LTGALLVAVIKLL